MLILQSYVVFFRVFPRATASLDHEVVDAEIVDDTAYAGDEVIDPSRIEDAVLVEPDETVSPSTDLVPAPVERHHIAGEVREREPSRKAARRIGATAARGTLDLGSLVEAWRRIAEERENVETARSLLRQAPATLQTEKLLTRVSMWDREAVGDVLRARKNLDYFERQAREQNIEETNSRSWVMEQYDAWVQGLPDDTDDAKQSKLIAKRQMQVAYALVTPAEKPSATAENSSFAVAA